MIDYPFYVKHTFTAPGLARAVYVPFAFKEAAEHYIRTARNPNACELMTGEERKAQRAA